MIEAIRNIGEYVSQIGSQGDSLLEGISLRVPDKDAEEQVQHTLIINFNTDIKKIEIDVQESNCKEANGDSGREYLWVGNFK